METKINVLFYKFEQDNLSELVSTIKQLDYTIDYKNADELSLVKSEIINQRWDVLVLNKGINKETLDEIMEFIYDLKSDLSLLYIVEKIEKELIQKVYQNINNDIVIGQNKSQIALAIIRAFECAKSIKQADFNQKELLRSQKTISEHDYFLNQVIESTTNAIYLKGIDGRYWGCNTAFANILELPKDQIIGKTVFDVAPNNLAITYNEMDQAFFKNPVTQQYESKVKNVAGETFDVLFFKTPLKDSEGNVIGLLGHMFNITEQKKTEQELYQEKEKVQLIIDSADEIYVSFDLEGNITSVNRKASEILNHDRDDLIGKNWFETFVLDKDKGEIKQLFQDILDGNLSKEERFERKLVTPLNKEILISWSSRILRDENGSVQGLLSLGRDVTHRSNLELELQVSERKYKTLVENMHEGIGIVDIYEKVVFCNEAFNKIFGFETGSMLGKNLKDYVIEEDLEQIYTETDKRKKNQKSQYLINITREDGKNRIVSVSSVPWKNNKNEVIGAIGLITDVTAQEFATKRLEQKVRIEQSIINISSQFINSDNFNSKLDATLVELKNIIEAERYGILLVQNSTLKLVSERYSENIDGQEISFEELSAKDFEYGLDMLDSFDFIFFDDVKQLPAEAQKEKEILSKYGIFNFLGIPFYSGEKLTGLITISNIYAVDEWTLEDLSSLRTISEIIEHAFGHNKAEEKVKQLNQDLIEKNKELEQVVYVTSHDIRSPIINILGFSDELIKALNVLAERIFDSSNSIANTEDIENIIRKKIPQILNFIKISGQKIDKLLLALLKLSRLGRATFNTVNVDMNQLINTVLTNYEFTIKQENIKIELDSLPGCYADELAVNQVFSNLIDNAIKYRSPERPLVIKITGNEDNGKVVYCIQDNGIGISEEELDKIFDVFYRIDPQNQVGEGIGLSLIKKTVEKLGGEISLGSKEGEGTSFYISLQKQKE